MTWLAIDTDLYSYCNKLHHTLRAYTVGDDSTGTLVHHSLQCAVAIILTSTDHNLWENVVELKEPPSKIQYFHNQPYNEAIIIILAINFVYMP